MKPIRASMLTALALIAYLTAYTQDTPVQIPINELRALYTDALQKDTCQKQNAFLVGINKHQQTALRLKDSAITYQLNQVKACELERVNTKDERNQLHNENINLKQKVQVKNKWLARSGAALAIETFIIVAFFL